METIKLISDKYGIEGEILDSNMVKTLSFSWDGRDITMGLGISIWGDDMVKLAKQIIDDYIDKLATPGIEKEVRLYYWYITTSCFGGENYLQAHGNVTGHNRIADSTNISTSEIMAYYVDEAANEMVIQTQNTVYHCDLRYCNYSKQTEYADLIPNLEELQSEYGDSIVNPEIEPGNVLLVLSNFDNYYYHSLYCVRTEGDELIKVHGWPHIGTFQDSFLVTSDDHTIDIRYYPHFQCIEFYMEDTGDMPLFLENIGTNILYAKTSKGTIKLNPGERKRVCSESVESQDIHLADGDLYPATIIEEKDNE